MRRISLFLHSLYHDMHYLVAERLSGIRFGCAASGKRVFFVYEGIFGCGEHGKSITAAATGLKITCRADDLVPWYG
jgi:hypothetical protein